MSGSTVAAPAPSPAPIQRLMIVDEKNMFRIWLEEQVVQNKLTPLEADKMLEDQESQGKLWTGPLKDSIGSGKVFFKLARDFASWKGAQVYFSKSKAGHDLVTFKGWPAGRKFIRGTRYRLDNPKIVELQIGKPGIRAAAKESARFGIYLVVAADVADYILRDNSTLAELLGSLTIDIPSVLLASAIGAVAGSLVVGSSIPVLAAIGTLAIGPCLVAFAVGVIAGVALYQLDKHFLITEKLTALYDKGIAKLSQVWTELGTEAETRFRQLASTQAVHDLRNDAHSIAQKLGRESDWVRGEMAALW
jgi:hypothetical protein